MLWLYTGVSPLTGSVWCSSMPSSPFASFVPPGTESPSKIEVLDSGTVKCSAGNAMTTFSCSEMLCFSSDEQRSVSAYFEATVASLSNPISSLSLGFSQPAKASSGASSFGQLRCSCLISISSSSITCDGSLVSSLPEDFVSVLREHGKQKGTVLGVHLDKNAGCITFSIATFAPSASPAPSSSSGPEAAAVNSPKIAPSKLVRHSVSWKPSDMYEPVVELMAGSIHLNSGEIPFSLEVPSGASALISELPKNVILSPHIAALLAAYADDKSNLRNCQQPVTSALVPALHHVLNSDAVLAAACQNAGSSSNFSLSKALAYYEQEISVLMNLLKDQDIYTALFRAPQEEDLKDIFSSTLKLFLDPSSDADIDSVLSPSHSIFSNSTPRDDPSSNEQPSNSSPWGVWADISTALSKLPRVEVAAVVELGVPSTPGTDDFALKAASSLFDKSPPPSPRNLSPVPREMRSLSLPEADITQDVFRTQLLACRSKFSAWLLEQFFLQATNALLGISDAQKASELSADSCVSVTSIWQNVFGTFVDLMSSSIDLLLSPNSRAIILHLFCIAMHCAGAIVTVKNATVSFLGRLLNFLENTFKQIRSEMPFSRSQLLVTRIPAYVLACSAQHSIDKNSSKQLDPMILHYLHSAIFDGGFLESFSKWKFLDEFGSRQSGISGTQKAHTAMSSFYEELATDTKSGSLWLSIFSHAVTTQGFCSNGVLINSNDDPVFKTDAFKAALSTFLHITGFADFCCSVPDTPDHIKKPIGKDTLKQLNPHILPLWVTFFKEIIHQFNDSDSRKILLSHCQLCLSLAPPSATVDGAVSSGSSCTNDFPAESLLERRISGTSVQGVDKYVSELVSYLNSSIDDVLLKSVAAERDLIIQSRSFGFQILRKLLQLVEDVDINNEFTLDFCRSMLCCVEMCFAPIVANERGSAHVVVGLSGTNRKSQQRLQSEWTQVMHCVIDTLQKIISQQSIGSSEALPFGFFLLNLFQQDVQWLNYGRNAIHDILTIASGLNASSSKLLETHKNHSELRNSQDFPSEGFAACAIADGEWLCHGGIIVINGIRTVFNQFWFIQGGECYAVTSDNELQRAWHTLSMVHSNEFVIIGGASMTKSSGLMRRAKVAIVRVHFDRTSMSVRLTGVQLLGFRSPVMHSAVVLSDSPISPTILVVGGLANSKTSAHLIFINVPDSAVSDPSQLASSQRKRSMVAQRRLSSSPPPAQPGSSPPRPSIPCIAAPVVYTNKVIDISPISSSNGHPFCFGCKPAVHRITASSQVLVSTISSEASDSRVLCLNSFNSYSWSIVPLEGWPMDRHCVVGSSFVPLQDGALLLVGGEDENTRDIATPIVLSLRNFSCEVLHPTPQPLRFGQHHCFAPEDKDTCNVLGNWRTVPHQQRLNESSFNLKSLRGCMRARGLASVLSGLCAQAVLVPDKGFKIPVLSPLLWTLQGQRLNHAYEEIKILRKSAAVLPSCFVVLHEPSFSVCDSVIEFLEQGPQLIGFWFSMSSFSKFSGTFFSIGGNGGSLCSLEIDACRYVVMKSVSGVSTSPSPLPSNCWVHIAVSFLPATIPQFCLYLNGYRLLRHDSWVSPMASHLRSKDLGLAFRNKFFVLCVGHREGTDNSAAISRVCLQKNFDFTSPSCFDVSSMPPPCVSRFSNLERDIGSVLQAFRSVPVLTLSHVIQDNKNLVLLFLDILFNESVSLAGPCALILVSVINEFPFLYTPEFLDSVLSGCFAVKLCNSIWTQSLIPGSFANIHHRNIYVFILRELMHNTNFQPIFCDLLISHMTSVTFDKDVETSVICCKQALALMDVFSNRLCVFPGLDVLVSPSPSSPSTRCVIMRVSADCAAVYIKSASAQSYSCENHPISHLQSIKSDKNHDALLLPSSLLSPFLSVVCRVLEARSRFQNAIPLSAFLDLLLEKSLQVISSSLACESSIDLSSYSESIFSQLLDLSFESTTDSRMDASLNAEIVDICLRLGWVVSKSAMSMVINPHIDSNIDKKEECSSSWMQVGSRPFPVVKSRHPTDSIFHLGAHLQSGTKLKVGLISSAAIRTVCNSLKGSSIPQTLLLNAHPYRRARFQITGEHFQPYPLVPVPVEDCLGFKLLSDGPRSIVSQNCCTETEGLFCSFSLSSKEYTIVGVVPNVQLHLANQHLEAEPVFFSPKIGQSGNTDQFKAVVSRGQELSGWREGQNITVIADPFSKVVSAFVEDTLVGAFRCDCRNMHFCIS